MSDIDELYKKLFVAEEKGMVKEVKRIRKKIRELIEVGKFVDNVTENINNNREDKIKKLEMKEIKESELDKLDEKRRAKIEFFYKTRKKAFHKNLREQIENPDDIELALALTSMLTHSLIEMKKNDKNIYHLLDIRILTETVSDYLFGDLSTEEVINIIDENWLDELTTKLITEDEK